MGSLNLCLLVLVWWVLLMGFSACQEEQGSSNSFVVSRFSYPGRKLSPYEWLYMRVELPPWFSSMDVNLVSDVHYNKESIEKLVENESGLPIICFRDGGPPLPDVSNTSLKDLALNLVFNGSSRLLQNLQSVGQCLPFQTNLTVTLTNEQISPGTWYIGLFNGLGLSRTQSKMISRGQSYSFSTSISVGGCTTSTLWGPYCNQTIDLLFCSRLDAKKSSRSLFNVDTYKSQGSFDHLISNGSNLVVNYQLPSVPLTAHNIETAHFNKERDLTSMPSMFTAMENVILCNNSIEAACLGDGDIKLYSLDMLGTTAQFKVIATAIKFNQTSSVNNTWSVDGVSLMCYARYNAMPLKTLHDYSADISRSPLVIRLPKIGRWYIAVHAVNQKKVNGTMQDDFLKANLCFSLEWQVHECALGKAGPNCTSESYMLQRVLKKNPSIAYESYYLPIGVKELSLDSANFPLEAILSNSSVDSKLDYAWTYFLLDVPRGAAGAYIHVQLHSDTKVTYEIYVKFGGMPSIDDCDYQVNSTSSSNGSMFLHLNDLGEDTINFYILYAREGTWSFGLKHAFNNHYKQQSTMSIAIEGCPRHCSSHGTCYYAVDETGLSFYSYCFCDRDHGGFDCSHELVSRQGHLWHSVFLVASNAAAILPAIWALRKKAFSEWVLFTSSGISSGLYHACDVGTWCVLSFRVLQFMDFWLSFMAVTSTFVYMATIGEASKRAILTCISILTALLAVSGATRSANIILVIAIGTLGLLIGWILEYSSAYRSIYPLPGCNLNVPERWRSIRIWLCNLIKTLRERFHWHFVIMGFIALAAAAVCWKLETNESYWIWHSLWHITIYTSSFFFLCSTSRNNRNQEIREPEYELARQNSSRIESTERPI